MRNRIRGLLSAGRDKLRGSDLALLVAAAVILAGAWCFVEIADQMRDGDTDRFDAWLLRACRQPNDPGQLRGPFWMGEVVRDVTSLGSPFLLLLTTIIAVGYLLVSRRPHSAGFVLLSILGGAILLWSLKAAFARPRPQIVPRLMEVNTHSFPSGHAQASTIVFLTLGTIIARLVPTRRRKVYILGTALFLAFLVGSSRVLLGVHYPTDVLAGWTAGVVWSLALWAIARALQQSRLVENATGSDTRATDPLKTDPM